MRALLKATAVCFLLFFTTLSSSAQVYKWKDKDGNLIISTTPPPPGVQSEKQSLQTGSNTSIDNSNKRAVQEVSLTRSNRDIKVIIYATEWCPYCKKAREYLSSLNLNLTVYDIEKDPEKNREFLAKGKNERGVPLIDVEGILMRGFSEKAIDTALDKRRHVVANY